MRARPWGWGLPRAPKGAEAIEETRRYLSYLPGNWQAAPAAAAPAGPDPIDLRKLVPVSERQAFDMRRYVRGIVDSGARFEIHELLARGLVTGLSRVDGEVVSLGVHN